VTAIDLNDGIEALPARPGLWRRLPRDGAVWISATILVAIVLAAIFAPLLAPYDPYETGQPPFIPPSFMEGGMPQFLLGTDNQGRDMLSRLLFGARTTLITGVLAIVFGGGTGVVLGIASAYFRRLSTPIMRCVDVLLSFPAILFGLAFAAVIGPGTTAVVIALSIAAVPDVARITRSTAVIIMGQEYMEAGRAIGLSDFYLITRYLALNCLGPVFVFLTLRFGQVILISAILSFLGLGARPPYAELGMMASQGRDALFFAPHIAVIPSLAIFVIVLCTNMLGDSLRDALDPRLRNT
jgi:ABC-type dipeptide/oligopeptide/nickel transport system permease subunit